MGDFFGDRERLPARRASVNYELRCGGRKAHISIGLYRDGTIGELRISTGKDGTDSVVYAVLARAISITPGRIDCDAVPAIHGVWAPSFWAAIGMLLDAECLEREDL